MKKTSVSLEMILPLLILTIILAGGDSTITWIAFIISLVISLPLGIYKLWEIWENHRFRVRLDVVYVFSEDLINREIEEYGNPFSGREKKLRLRFVVPKDDISIEKISYMYGKKVVATAEYNEFRSWIFTEKESPATLTLEGLWRDKNITKFRAVVKPTNGRVVKSNYIKTSQLKGISGMFIHSFNPEKEFSNLDEEEQKKS